MDETIQPGSVQLMDAAALGPLFTSLRDAGFSVIGPTVADGGFEAGADNAVPPRLAFFGVRPCDLRAIGIQDQVLGSERGNSRYGARRAGVLIVAVNCTEPGETCFCTAVEDISDLSGDHAERWQHWASCFDVDFSYIHGGPVRASADSRHRQWLIHKLGTWHDQFGSSGCVGCGRCIVWCPVGIDITEEVAALRAETPAAGAEDGAR